MKTVKKRARRNELYVVEYRNSGSDWYPLSGTNEFASHDHKIAQLHKKKHMEWLKESSNFLRDKYRVAKYRRVEPKKRSRK